jgi:hypothetical protein
MLQLARLQDMFEAKLPVCCIQTVHLLSAVCYQNVLKENCQKIKYFYNCELFLCYVYNV